MKAVWGLQEAFISRQDGKILQTKKQLPVPQTYRRESQVSTCSFRVDVDLSPLERLKETVTPILGTKIIINIRGRVYETFRETLERFPNTLLGCSEMRQDYYHIDNEQYYFGLRDVSSFDAILFYYQSNGILARPADVDILTFYKELRFFKIDERAVQLFLQTEGVTIPKEKNESPEMLPGRKMWKFLEYPSYSRTAQAFAVCSLLVICLSIVTFCGETLQSVRENSEKKTIFIFLEIFCIAWFSLEYLLRLASSPNRKKFIKSPIGFIDILAIVPFLVATLMAALNFGTDQGKLCCIVRVLKLLRVLRVLKFTRYVHGLNILGLTIVKSARELFLLLMYLSIGSVLFSSLVYLTDLSEADTEVSSIAEGLWFSIITLSTVGYGDVVPVSNLGKVCAVLCMLAGVLVLSIPVPVIVRNFTNLYAMRKRG